VAHGHRHEGPRPHVGGHVIMAEDPHPMSSVLVTADIEQNIGLEGISTHHFIWEIFLL
jgi:hypothetical protein